MILANYKYFKWIALIFGWYLGGILGAVIAYFVVEALMYKKNEDLSFDIALLKICTMLIQSDGKVDPEEVNAVREFYYRTFGRRKSEKVFREIKISDLRNYSLDQLIDILKLRLSPTKYYAILQILYAIAAADGEIAQKEDLFIEEVAAKFGFSKDRLQTIRNQFIKTKTGSKTNSQKIFDSLNVLGLKTGASNADIKSAYRNLAKEYHPDKLTGMSPGIQDLAKEKFQMIQEAYEYLKDNYVKHK